MTHRGIEAFLACHYRLGRLTRTFVPYGTTLFVALLLMDSLETSAIADELDMAQRRSFGGTAGGGTHHNVGMADISQDLVYSLVKRLERSDCYHRTPRPGELYLASLAIMAAADDHEIHDAYDRMVRLIESAE